MSSNSNKNNRKNKNSAIGEKICVSRDLRPAHIKVPKIDLNMKF